MSTKIELASKKNADLTHWDWDDNSRQKWEKARPAVQEFYKKWRVSSETALSQEVYIGHVPGFKKVPNQFIVRNSYKTTFDRIWQRAFRYPRTAVDVSASEPGPDLVFGDDIFPIQASSPNPSHFKRWAKTRNAAMWGLPLWDETELNMALQLQPEYPAFKALLEEGMLAPLETPEEISIKAALDTLKKWTEKKNHVLEDLRTDDDSDEEKIIEKEDEIYGINMSTIDGALEVLVHAAIQDSGPVARDVYESIFLPTLASKNRANAIAVVTYENLQALSKTFRANFTFPEQSISHRIITVNPVPDDLVDAYEQFYDEWKIEYRSIQIVREMAQKLEKEKDEATRRVMRGDITVDAPVLVTDFEKDERSDERLPGGDRGEVHFRGPDFSSPTTEYYYIPQRSNFPLFDSFLVEQQNNEVTLWVFQMSVSLVHGGSREGYASIRRIIESLKIPPSDDGDRKKTKKPRVEINITVKYVYVVPWERDRVKFQWHCPAAADLHRGPDGLSRMPPAIDDTDEEDESDEEELREEIHELIEEEELEQLYGNPIPSSIHINHVRTFASSSGWEPSPNLNNKDEFLH
ncbi:hypothetical protein Clacol_001339 [Clathrus columnatus]|uniref:Uncharacterized protein n=1 Tax=Clathrus columnatus TaxID=1419009 RepID=A0AAV4ZY28_9AGAM|nr:hypothetical protein Clacol_001339 [Clathrus columnatus]